MDYKVFLGGINRVADDDTVNEFTRKFGNLCEIINTGKGYAFIKFETTCAVNVCAPRYANGRRIRQTTL